MEIIGKIVPVQPPRDIVQDDRLLADVRNFSDTAVQTFYDLPAGRRVLRPCAEIH